MSRPARLFRLWLLCALPSAIVLPAHPPSSIVVSDAWVRETSATRTTSSAYFTVENGTDRAVTLTAVSVEGVDQSALHATVDENGIASMKPQKGLTIPARGSLALAPGAAHVMLTGVRSPLKVGGSVRMTLSFEGAPAQVVRALVRPLAATGIR